MFIKSLATNDIVNIDSIEHVETIALERKKDIERIIFHLLSGDSVCYFEGNHEECNRERDELFRFLRWN